MDKVDTNPSDQHYSNSSSSSAAGPSHDDFRHSNGSTEGIKKVTYNPTSMEYDMSGEKLMFIFNHLKFQDTPYFLSCPTPRDGTEQDVKRLQKTFGKIGFTVEPCNDYTQQKILEKLENICKMDHKNTSCIIIVILTHGDGGGIVNAADMPYLLSNVVNPILQASSLAGKPKLFLIQACRGRKTDSGQLIQNSEDGDQSKFTIPTHSDYFLLRSSFEDHVSYRNPNGSWLIQALCDVVDEHRRDQHILDIATKVNHIVAQHYTFSKVDLFKCQKKQIPEVWFTLTKNLYIFK